LRGKRGKSKQGHPVFRLQGVQSRTRLVFQIPKVRLDAAAEIDDQGDTQGKLIAGKVSQPLDDAVVVYKKITGLQVALWISCDGNIDRDEIHGYRNREIPLAGLRDLMLGILACGANKALPGCGGCRGAWRPAVCQQNRQG